MSISNLSGSVKITVGALTGAGTTTINSPTIDMRGYDSVLFVSTFGTSAANNSVKVAQDTQSSMATEADLAGTLVGVGASDETVWVEVVKPLERYVRAKFVRGTSTTIGEIYCLQFSAAALPVSNALAGTIAGELWISPAEGTA